MSRPGRFTLALCLIGLAPCGIWLVLVMGPWAAGLAVLFPLILAVVLMLRPPQR